jgi:hypothetical protein
VRFKLPIGILSQHLQHRIQCSKNQETKKTDNIVTGMHQMATHQHFPESRTFFFNPTRFSIVPNKPRTCFTPSLLHQNLLLLKYTKTHTYTQRDAARKRLPTIHIIFRYFRTKTKTCVSSFLSKSLKSIPKICTNKETKQEKHLPEAQEAAVA